MTESLTEKQKMIEYRNIAGVFSSYAVDSVLVYAPKAIALAEKFDEKDVEIVCYAHLIAAHCFKSNYDSAFMYFDKGREIAVKINDKQSEAGLISLAAYTYKHQGKYNTAIDMYLKVLSINESLKSKNEGINNPSSVSTLTNLGRLNRILNNTTIAIEYLDKAIEACMTEKMTPDFYELRITKIYNEYAAVYLDQGDLEQALEYAAKSDEINVTNHILNKCDSKVLQSRIYLKLNRFEKALLYINEAMEFANILDDNDLYIKVWMVLSDIYMAQKKYIEAEREAQKAWQADSTDINDSRIIALNIAMANIYTNNKDKAAYYLKKYSEMNELYSKKSFHTTVADMNIKYETEKKELHIASLEQEKQLYTWLGGLGVITVILGSALFFYRNRLNKQRIKQLEQEKQLVATQALLDGETAERSRLARDLHDGLGGLLSLLKLNLNEINKTSLTKEDEEYYEKVSEILEESNKELRRIAHHMMPASLMKTGLKTSLSDFCQAIPGVTFQYQGKDIRLDERLEVTLYRCTYELINNAVKYADATKIDVQLLVEDNLISLSVYDNGIGFDPQSVTTGSGLDNIRTRIATFNGKMYISSSENGTEITIEIEQS